MKKKILLFASCIAYLGFAQAQAPVARWTFNNGTANNDAGTIAHGTITNAVEALSYNGTKAFDFNGNDAKISFDNNYNAVFADSSFTISLWAMPRAAVDKDGNRSVLMAKWVSTGEPNNGFILWIDGFDTQASSLVNDPNSISFPTPQLNVWHHYVVQQNRDSLTVFIDNKPVAISKNFRYNANDKELSLGALYTNSYNFDGKIDEIQLFDRCVSRSEVDSLYKLMPTINSFSLNDVLLAKDSSQALKLSIEPFYDLQEFVDFNIIDPTVISIDANGNITGLKVGQTRVAVSTRNKTLTDTCTVRVINEKILVHIADGALTDKSGNQCNATLLQSGTTTNRYLQRDSAFAFLADGDALKIMSDSLLNPKHITLAAWYKPSSFVGSGQDGIIEKSFISNVSPFYQYQLWVCGNEYPNNDYKGSFGFQMTTNDNKSININTAANAWEPGKWYFIVATFDGTQAKLFVNGKLCSQTACVGNLAAYPTDLYIGKRGNLEKSLRGTIDEARVYAHALTTSQIDSLFKLMPAIATFAAADIKLKKDSSALLDVTIDPFYDLSEFCSLESLNPDIASVNDTGLVTAHKIGSTRMVVATINGMLRDTFTVYVPDTTMFAYYNFENNVADDRSFNGYNGTIINAEPTSNRFGQSSAALLFGSANKSVNIKDVDLRGSQISFATWIYVNNFQTDVNHISSIVGLYQNGWCGLRIGDASWAENNRAQIVLGNQNATQWVRLKSKTELQTKQYYHIVATYDGAMVKLYINGVLDTATAYNQKITTFGTMEIGASANERPLDGSIDEVRVYRRAITAHEVDSLFSIVPISKIEFAENTLSLPIDSSYMLQYTSVPQYDLSKFIRYSVSDNSIARIENGKITALQKGETTVTIETLNKTIKTSFTLFVTKPATSVLLNKQSLSLQVSNAEQLNTSVAPSDASNTEIEYTSSNTTVAQVSSTGMVTAIAAGQALIIATHKQNAKLADTCTVTVSKPITNRDEQTNSMLSIPNLVKNEILVSESEDVLMMQLISADGRIVVQSQNTNLLLLDTVRNGSYFLKIITKSRCVVQQISVQQ